MPKSLYVELVEKNHKGKKNMKNVQLCINIYIIKRPVDFITKKRMPFRKLRRYTLTVQIQFNKETIWSVIKDFET